MVKKASQA